MKKVAVGAGSALVVLGAVCVTIAAMAIATGTRGVPCETKSASKPSVCRYILTIARASIAVNGDELKVNGRVVTGKARVGDLTIRLSAGGALVVDHTKADFPLYAMVDPVKSYKMPAGKPAAKIGRHAVWVSEWLNSDIGKNRMWLAPIRSGRWVVQLSQLSKDKLPPLLRQAVSTIVVIKEGKNDEKH